MSRKPLIRCAIYTRKSSEEGLEQDFNSLDAQREACEAYVRSQAHEEWKALPELFDDGGFSGGTLERPALRRLMEMVRARRIDVIVIYKIDRLTRSLPDFARLAEQFEAHGVSFVSVTQQFNTTTSMGRLMLNVLLSFAQFEREITGERIRDKIAASKKKGLWMGGATPFGYDLKDRTLTINDEEAADIRAIFGLYLELGTVGKLLKVVEARGIRTRRRTSSNGRETGGNAIGRGHLYYLLSNPVYAGRIRHKDKTYAGAHPAIIDQVTWGAVQALLADNTQGPRKRRPRPVTEPGWLAGLLVDQQGKPFALDHANKGGKRYRYYVERPTHKGADDKLRRVPAGELEKAVQDATWGFIRDPLKLIDALEIGRPEQTGSLFDARHLFATADGGSGRGNMGQSHPADVEADRARGRRYPADLRQGKTPASTGTADTNQGGNRHPVCRSTDADQAARYAVQTRYTEQRCGSAQARRHADQGRCQGAYLDKAIDRR